MQWLRVHPVLLIGILSLVVSAFMEWLAYPRLPSGFMDGFLDGLGVAYLCGHLLAVRRGEVGGP